MQKRKTVFLETAFKLGKNSVDACFRQYYSLLCHFAYGYLKEIPRAEDAVQSVFSKMLESEYHFQSEQHLKNFLYKAVRNACLNEQKSIQIHARQLNRFQEETLTDDDMLFRIVRSEIYQKIWEAVENLPLACRNVFKMAYFEQYDNEEIAQKLGVSINTVKVHKNKAKHLLREQLKELYPIAILFLSLNS